MQTARGIWSLGVWGRKVDISGRAIEKWEAETNQDCARIPIDRLSALHGVASNNWLLRTTSAFVPHMPLFRFTRFHSLTIIIQMDAVVSPVLRPRSGNM